MLYYSIFNVVLALIERVGMHSTLEWSFLYTNKDYLSSIDTTIVAAKLYSLNDSCTFRLILLEDSTLV